MRKIYIWMVLIGILLILGGLLIVGLFYRHDLPNSIDIFGSLGKGVDFLHLLAPATPANGNERVNVPQAAVPELSSKEGIGSALSPKYLDQGLVPDRLVIPSIHLDAPILPVKSTMLMTNNQAYYQWSAPNQYAVGRQESSALLGMPGNMVLNGHHNVYGMVFKDLADLTIWDVIIIYSGSQEFHYQVAANWLLPERDEPMSTRLENARWITASSDERITLITCWPPESNTHRIVVVAFRIGTRNYIPATERDSQSLTILCSNNTKRTIDVFDLSKHPGYLEDVCTYQTPGLSNEK